MDRAYKEDIPAARKALQKLSIEFSRLDLKTDWKSLRVEPLLEHARSLERLLRSTKFARQTERLPRGVSMFHADLVYFRENLRTLKAILEVERKSRSRASQDAGPMRKKAAPKRKRA